MDVTVEVQVKSDNKLERVIKSVETGIWYVCKGLRDGVNSEVTEANHGKMI